MKNRAKSNHKSIQRILLAACLTAFCLAPVACAKKPVLAPEPPPPVPPRVVSFRFEQPLVVATPSADPVTAQEHIRCGLFYFQHCRYDEAASAFALARERITDPRNALSRHCLVSEAVCYLLSDNKPAFVRTLNTLRATYTHYELMAMEHQDLRLKALTDMCDAFGQIGYK